MIDLTEVGAFGAVTSEGSFQIRFGVYLPTIRAADGFDLIVRLIHESDRFDPNVPTDDTSLIWSEGHPLDLWTVTVAVPSIAGTNFGQEGTYLYRYQLWWTPPGGTRQLITKAFNDPFARATEIGSLSAVPLFRTSTPFVWTDASYKTPELDDLIVYELQVEEFNDTFDGVADRLTYLQSLGVNCLELMPVTSPKLDFDWGYGPLNYFAPSARFGGVEGLKRLIDACHQVNMAVILDVVYQHVDPTFPYSLVYDDVSNTAGAPAVTSPMIGGTGDFGPEIDFSKTFAQQYVLLTNQQWLDDYHVDGFRYDEVTDLYQSPTDTGYAKLAYDTYGHSLTIARFAQGTGSYSRIIQCAEALSIARTVLENTYTNCVWQDDLLNDAEAIVGGTTVGDWFAHQLDPFFIGYPSTKTVIDANGNAVDMPVAPFQYLNTHDHSHLIVSAGTSGDGPLPTGDRSRFYLLQPLAIALFTLQGIPMLWQGEEFAENYELPGSGAARVNLRRNTHWEYFYDDDGSPLVRVYRQLGQLRRNNRALRSRESFYYNQQSLQGNQVIAYHRHAASNDADPEQYAMVLINFGASDATIQVPFPTAGTWQEMLDADLRILTISVAADQALQTLTIPSHYGMVFLQK